jgi:hypothetical protein
MVILIGLCGLYVMLYGGWWMFTTYPSSAGVVFLISGMGLVLVSLAMVFP